MRAAEQRLHENQHSLGEAQKESGRVERTIAEKESKLEILRQLNEEGEGLAKGSQAILKEFRPAIGGALVAALNVERDYIPALEAALGRNMHAVVLENGERATEILQHVANNKLGQAALALPTLTAIATDDYFVDLPSGAISWAIDKVSAPEALTPLVRRLLRGVVLVSDLDTAIHLKQQQPVLQFATLAGEFISTAGVIFGGSSNAQSESLLGRKAQIDETAQQLSDQQAALAILEQRLEQLRTAVSSASAELEEARLRHQAAHLRQSNSAAQILLLSHQLRAAEEKLQQLQTERTTLEQQTTFADSHITQLDEELARLTSTIAEQQTQRTFLAETTEQAQLHEEETSE